MPLPNGVLPTGEIHSICPSAGWLGNRGMLHDANGIIVRQWQRKAWVTCLLSYKGRNRKPLMQPGRYTELFFLDEATALAAGHRPCGECRRDDYNHFKRAWVLGNRRPDDTTIADIDKAIHDERTSNGDAAARLHELGTLPSGVLLDWVGVPHLWTGNALLKWTPQGYVTGDAGWLRTSNVRIITPPSVVRALAAGYVACLHKSASTAA
ncbi:hypothetical protein R77567_03280 [Ralstonia sp. LMG 32965]|uniref:Uncharacterized protein n=1 Tax=Ralstonia flatus TaxID=3058601 RepID=A0AAD2BZD4_9RALS|nr:hypothetical protein R77567_03280 [Ralstonia sp. LMG 32965]CAJ0887779.1 hypothetical protein R77564_03236 [Ralstonia sp. LMG 32965]